MLSRLITRTARALGLRERIDRAVAREVQSAVKAERPRMEARLRARLDAEVGKTGTKIQQATKRNVAELRKSNAELARANKKALHKIKLLEAALIENDRDRETIITLPQRLNAASVREHVVRRIQSTDVTTDPYPHLFVEELFPEDFYDLLIEAIPHEMFFPSRDRVKQNFTPRRAATAPAKSKIVWEFIDTVFCGETLLPALTARFEPFLDKYYAAAFGPDFVERARALPQVNTKGRLMCRRPGYKLRPHLDPKRVLLTSLLYLPRSADEDERYGTQIFRSDRDFVARYLNTYYPEPDGIKCELVKTVPFRRNSLLVFLNDKAIHGAEISPDEAPKDLERYAYQFYIGPEPQALKEIIEALPEERQAAWRQRTSVRAKKDLGDWHEDKVELVDRSAAESLAAP